MEGPRCKPHTEKYFLGDMVRKYKQRTDS
jgi:hypothetical protein